MRHHGSDFLLLLCMENGMKMKVKMKMKVVTYDNVQKRIYLNYCFNRIMAKEGK